MARIKDIAERAGASTSAVSLVLNGKADAVRISKETQQRILDAASELGYIANIQARRLRSNAYMPSIALCWPADKPGVSLMEMMSGLLDAREKKQTYDVVMRPYKAGKLNAHEMKHLQENYNAVLFVGMTEEDRVFIERSDIEIPICCVGWESKRHSSIALDIFTAGRDTAALFAAHKLERVAFVGDVEEDVSLLNGFAQGCKENKMEFDSDLVFACGPRAFEGERIAEIVLASARRPEGLLFASDEAAIGALQAFHRRNVDIPGRIKIVAKGTVALAEYTIPSLSVITSPMDALFKEGMALLEKQLKSKTVVHSSKPMDFVYRQSCEAAPNKKAYRIFI